jgi:hypothetical protein
MEDELSQVKKDYNHQIEKLNFEILEMRRKETEYERIIEIEKKKNHELSKEFEAIKESKMVLN